MLKIIKLLSMGLFCLSFQIASAEEVEEEKVDEYELKYNFCLANSNYENQVATIQCVNIVAQVSDTSLPVHVWAAECFKMFVENHKDIEPKCEEQIRLEKEKESA